MKRLMASVLCFTGFIATPGFGQTNVMATKAQPTAAATALPARVHRQVKRHPVEVTPAVTGRGGAGNVKPARPPVISYADAVRRGRRERHNRVWWRSHFSTIVLVSGCYYYWDAGYWFPAFGYGAVDAYDYDGPIFTYGNLLPDQVIINVQRALQELGYYAGGLTGSLGPSTRAAIAAYQQDAGLFVTAAVDEATVEALGLY